MKLFSPSLILALAFAQTAVAQKSALNGLLLDDAQDPVPFASVYLLDSLGRVCDSTLTTPWGDYDFPRVQAGRYQVRVASPFIGTVQLEEKIALDGREPSIWQPLSLPRDEYRGVGLEPVQVEGVRPLLEAQPFGKPTQATRSIAEIYQPHRSGSDVYVDGLRVFGNAGISGTPKPVRRHAKRPSGANPSRDQAPAPQQYEFEYDYGLGELDFVVRSGTSAEFGMDAPSRIELKYGLMANPMRFGDRRWSDMRVGNSTAYTEWVFKERETVTAAPPDPIQEPKNGETFLEWLENEPMSAQKEPVTTFSTDVDRAAYAVMRRDIDRYSRLPNKYAVRIEEYLNYFTYNYPKNSSTHPISAHTELSDCVWNPKVKLLQIGVQTNALENSDLYPANNLVFLVDVSGSMQAQLPLVKETLRVLVQNLREKDRVAIVVYAGAAGLVLPSTSGANKSAILAQIEAMEAGGSTAGGAGIELAYRVARENRTEGSNNRVILATDGDFNVGISDPKQLESFIAERRKDGVFLTGLGFGYQNYNDATLQTLTNKGNGNAAFIDDLAEAKKMLGRELNQTLQLAAKDVKIQVAFNPAQVRAYRLVGYETRNLRNEDFDDDSKDAGDLGYGHQVTALYEVELAPQADPAKSLAELRFRYKKPKSETSVRFEQPVSAQVVALHQASEDFRWASAVAGFGMWLRESKHQQKPQPELLVKLAGSAIGADPHGERAEFIGLLQTAILLRPKMQ